MRITATRFLLALATLGLGTRAMAQNEFYNDGALVHVQAGGLIYVQGSVTNDDQGGNVGTIRNLGNIQLTGNWANTGTSTTVFTANDPGTTTFLGTGAVQTIGGTNTTLFNNLTINKSGATTQELRLLINSGTDQLGVLSLTNDFLNTQTFSFGVSNPAVLAITRTGAIAPANIMHSLTEGYVTSTPGSAGRLGRAAAPGLTYFFPLGNGTRFRPITITNNSGVLNGYTAQFVNVPTFSTNLKAPTLSTINPSWYHFIERQVGGADAADIRIYHDFGPDNVCDINMVTMSEWNLSLWADLSPTTSNNPAPFMSWTQKSAYPATYPTPWISNSFALAGLFLASGAMSCVFPVEYLSLTAEPLDNSIMLNWETATEVNNAGFEVHRSTDGINFEQVGWVTGMGNSSSPTAYDYEDRDVVANQRYFYRLNQLDFNGGQSISNTVEAIILKGQDYIVGGFFPNPSNGNVNLWMSIGEDMPFELEVYNAVGQVVHSETRDIDAGYHQLDFDFTQLAKGSYIAHVKLNGEVMTRKLVLQ